MDADTVLPSLEAKATTNEPEPPRRPFSLAARAALATGLVLAAFLGVVGLTVSRTNADSALKDQQERLENFVTAYLAGMEVTRSGKVFLPDTPPDQAFSRPGSGLYAVVIGDNNMRLESPSALGRDFSFLKPLPPGQSQFGPIDTRMGRLYYYSYGISWDLTEHKSVPMTVMVAQTEDVLEGQNAETRRNLVLWLSTLGVMLIILQLLLLRWSLTPLRAVASEMSRVERGEAEHLNNQYPLELVGLTERINAFSDSEREQRTRYRNTLADLAHSLKTPLAVIRSRLELTGAGETPIRNDVFDQVRRMDELVAYQLARAATSGRQTFATTAVPIAGHAEDLVQSLEKVYAAKNVLCEFDIDEGSAFYGEQGDLLELMGNLLENAFKWAKHRVLLVVRAEPSSGRQRSDLWLSVEDDGPGIDPDKVEKVLQRGVRGDERVQGHGIGLSIVQDIVRAYQGELTVDRSPEFGGARFAVRLPSI